MPRSASSAEVQKNFGAYREMAQAEPIIVQHYGAPSVVIISAAEYERLRSLDREVLTIDELSDDDLNAMATAEIPLEYQYSIDDLKD